MKLPRISLSTSLLAILVSAVAFGVARDLLVHDRGRLSILGLGFLPMAIALALGLYRVVRRRGGPFAVGFVVAGLVATAAYVATILLSAATRDVLNSLFEALDARYRAVLTASWADEGEVLSFSEWLVVAPVLSIPPLLVALAGGLFARRSARRPARPEGRTWRRPRLTLATVAFLVLVLAADFGLIRHLIVDQGAGFGTTVGIGLLPMANALVLGLPRVLRGRSRFLLGFEVTGGAVVVAYLTACILAPGVIWGRFQSFAQATITALDLAFGSGRAVQWLTTSSFLGVAAEIALIVTFFSLPPLVVALSGGAVSRRFGRRSPRAT